MIDSMQSMVDTLKEKRDRGVFKDIMTEGSAARMEINRFKNEWAIFDKNVMEKYETTTDGKARSKSDVVKLADSAYRPVRMNYRNAYRMMEEKFAAGDSGPDLPYYPLDTEIDDDEEHVSDQNVQLVTIHTNNKQRDEPNLGQESSDKSSSLESQVA